MIDYSIFVIIININILNSDNFDIKIREAEAMDLPANIPTRKLRQHDDPLIRSIAGQR